MKERGDPFGKIEKKKVFEDVAKRIRDLVDDGTLEPGDQLPAERDLADRLGVSRTSVREAIRGLELTGEVETRVGVSGGTFVREVSLPHAFAVFQALYKRSGQMLSQVIEVRLMLETNTAYLAAERRTEEDLAAIFAAIAEMEEDVSSGGIGMKGDHDFHLAVAKASENDFLYGLAGLLENMIEQTRRNTLRIPGIPQESVADHRTIADAIRDRNGQLAESLMRKHLLKAFALSKGTP